MYEDTGKIVAGNQLLAQSRNDDQCTGKADPQEGAPDRLLRIEKAEAQPGPERKSKLVKNSGRIPNRDIQKPISTGKRPMLIWIRFRFMGCTSFLYSKIIVTERPIACNEML